VRAYDVTTSSTECPKNLLVGKHISPLYVTKSMIDSGRVWGIIYLLFLVKNRKEAEDDPGGFFRRDKSASIPTGSCEDSLALSTEPQSDKRDI
jgi:hypothetical protein